tara:strand:+ start:437 stop:676 length:240 start_codon:yes stop_codon:yes gene_type:complete
LLDSKYNKYSLSFVVDQFSSKAACYSDKYITDLVTDRTKQLKINNDTVRSFIVDFDNELHKFKSNHKIYISNIEVIYIN